MSSKKGKWMASLLLSCFSVSVLASVTVPMFSTDKDHQQIGTITFKNTLYGLMITPDLKGLTPGMHGLHVHDKALCGAQGKDAGGHLDPENTGKHLGPYDTQGHLGDLPGIFVNSAGVANKPVVAPRVHEASLYGHALVIHAGGDNFLDTPKPQGGGGERVACGVAEAPKK